MCSLCIFLDKNYYKIKIKNKFITKRIYCKIKLNNLAVLYIHDINRATLYEPDERQSRYVVYEDHLC